MTTVIADPVSDVMSDRLEEALRDRLLARSEWNIVQVCYRGEPGIVPVRLYPFGVVFITTEAEGLGADGYTSDTGPVASIRYDGFVTVEVLVSDTRGLVPDMNRKADVASYLAAKKLIQTAKQVLTDWAVDADGVGVVISADGKERLSTIRVDNVQNALTVRPNETIANTATLPWHAYTRRAEF
jgi:hypothetical protein